MYCFNIVDEIPQFVLMGVDGHVQAGFFETTALEWHEWQPGVEEKKTEKEAEPGLKRLMGFGSFQVIQQEVAAAIQQVVKGKPKIPAKASAIKSARSPYRSYSPLQVQELLDPVIGQGMSARQAGITAGIVVRTAQRYVKNI
jgi:hypothetical protein